MASPEHLEIINQGPNYCNSWRKKTGLTYPDLSMVDLTGTNVIHANLSGAILDGIKLFGSARDNWVITGVKCTHFFEDEGGKNRIPSERDCFSLLNLLFRMTVPIT